MDIALSNIELDWLYRHDNRYKRLRRLQKRRNMSMVNIRDSSTNATSRVIDAREAATSNGESASKYLILNK